MKQSERFALMEWLSEFPDDKTYDEIMEMMRDFNHTWTHEDLSVWEVVENYELSEVADMIENTRMHFESANGELISALRDAIKLAYENAPEQNINNFGVGDEDFTDRLNALQGVLAEWEVL
jgi:MoxR-like ATPase